MCSYKRNKRSESRNEQHCETISNFTRRKNKYFPSTVFVLAEMRVWSF